jgi:hypothetical protein
MARGGKREGAGRKAVGVTKKVSLTLTEEQWERLEKEESISAGVRNLVSTKRAILFDAKNLDAEGLTKCIKQASVMMHVKSYVIINPDDEGDFLIVADFDLTDELAKKIMDSLEANYSDEELQDIVFLNKPFEVRGV